MNIIYILFLKRGVIQKKDRVYSNYVKVNKNLSNINYYIKYNPIVPIKRYIEETLTVDSAKVIKIKDFPPFKVIRNSKTTDINIKIVN